MSNPILHTPPVVPFMGGVMPVHPDECLLKGGFPVSPARGVGLAYCTDKGSAAAIGIANSWSVGSWFSLGSVTLNQCVLDIGNTSDNTNRIRISGRGDVANDPFRIELWDSGATQFKLYDYNSLFSTTFSVHHLIVTWDGTTLKTYVDGNLTTASATTTDSAGTMTDTSRIVALAGVTNGSGNLLSAGTQHSAYIWNSVLTADEVAALFNKGVGLTADPRSNFRGYVSSSNLQHFWTYEKMIVASNICEILDKGNATIPLTMRTSVGGATYSPSSNLINAPAAVGVRPTGCYHDLSSTEYLLNTTNQTIGIANAWTIQFFTNIQTVASSGTMIEIKNTANANNQIRIAYLGASAGDPMQVLITNSAGSTIKDYSYNLMANQTLNVSYTTYTLFTFTWDGTNLLAYRNGNSVSPTTLTTDTTGTMTDSTRSVGINIRVDGTTGSAQRWVYTAAWNKALAPAEVAAIWHGGVPNWVDLSKNQGKYQSAANLKHWWTPGPISTTLGTSSSIVSDEVASGGIDLSVNASGVSVGTSGDFFIGNDLRPGASLCCGQSPGSTQYLYSPNSQTLGIANSWTIAFSKLDDSGNNGDRCILDINSGGANGIQINIIDAATDYLQVKLWDSSGVLFKSYRSTTGAGNSAVVPRYFWLTWDGTTLNAYRDGSLTFLTWSTKDTDSAGTMTDTARRVFIGADSSGSNIIRGTIGSIAMWNTVIETGSLYSFVDMYLTEPYQDYRETLKKYTYATNLQHWWRVGQGVGFAADLVSTSPINLVYAASPEQSIGAYGLGY